MEIYISALPIILAALNYGNWNHREGAFLLKNHHLKLIILILIITFNCSIEDKTFICKIVSVEGNVYETDENGNIATPLKKDSLLKTTSVIKTGNNSFAEIQFSDNSKMRIQENSVIKIERFYKGYISEKTRIYIELGEAFARLDNVLTGKEVEFETETILIKEKNAQFIISVSEDKVTKVAVYNGKLNYSTKINSEELDAIKKLEPEAAAKIEKIMLKNKTLSANDYIEIRQNEYHEYNAQFSKIVNLINRELESSKNNPAETHKILKKYADSLEKLANDTKIIKQEKLTDKDWEKILNSVKDGKTSIDAFKENKYVWTIKKLPVNPGIILTEKNTALTSDTKNLYISSNSNIAIFSINPAEGKINWKFSDQGLRNIYSMATPYMNLIILGTPDKLFMINIDGKKVMEKNITGGLTFWASPVIMNNNMYIPSSEGIYRLNNDSMELIGNTKNLSGQLYITADSGNLFIMDINESRIKVYNISQEKIIWQSDIIPNQPFMAPVYYNGYIFAADSISNLYKYDFRGSLSKPEILKIDSGVTANLIIKNEMIYFIANDGFFYKADALLFKNAKKIIRTEISPDMNKFLTKKLLYEDDEIFFCSDTGRLFVYNIKTDTGNLINIEENRKNVPLISSPVLIGNVIFFMDKESNIYKRFRNIE